MSFCRLEIITKIERNHALQLIKDAISADEGWIVTHQLFSNVSASISFEMPSGNVKSFIDNLKATGFSPRHEDTNYETKNADIRGLIAFTFIHDEPDLKRDVPAFG